LPTSTGGASINLNGTTAYLEAPSAAELNPSADWTVEVWFRDETPGGYNHARTRILAKGNSSLDPEVPYFLTIESNELVAGFRVGGSSRVLRYNLALGGVTANAWHHVAATYSAATRALTLYIDGVQVAQNVGIAAGTTGNTRPVRIGRDGSGSFYWRGKLDDLRIWAILRTPAEIQATFRSEFTTSPPGLVANWRFAEGTGPFAVDYAGTRQDATLLSGATWSVDTHP
jgi:hypothetical protein